MQLFWEERDLFSVPIYNTGTKQLKASVAEICAGLLLGVQLANTQGPNVYHRGCKQQGLKEGGPPFNHTEATI